MKVMIDIPKDFEKHFNKDRVKDSLERTKNDVCYGIEHDETISGIYEIELLDMLVKAFEEAEAVHSTCKLEGIPIYEMDYDTFGTQLMMKEMDEINVAD